MPPGSAGMSASVSDLNTSSKLSFLHMPQKPVDCLLASWLCTHKVLGFQEHIAGKPAKPSVTRQQASDAALTLYSKKHVNGSKACTLCYSQILASQLSLWRPKPPASQQTPSAGSSAAAAKPPKASPAQSRLAVVSQTCGTAHVLQRMLLASTAVVVCL